MAKRGEGATRRRRQLPACCDTQTQYRQEKERKTHTHTHTTSWGRPLSSARCSSTPSPLSKIYGIGAVSTPTAAATAHTDAHTHCRRWQRSDVKPVCRIAIGVGFAAAAARQLPSRLHTRTCMHAHTMVASFARDSDSAAKRQQSRRPLTNIASARAARNRSAELVPSRIRTLFVVGRCCCRCR